jgi:hypothetical protein
MSLSGDNYNHMATVLGYSLHDFESMLAATSLMNGRGVVYSKFSDFLRLTCVQREVYRHDDGGKTRKEIWVRFVPPNEYSSNDNCMPYSESAEVFTKAYFKTLRDLICKHAID